MRDSALCSEDCLSKLIGELDPNQSGTVGEGDDELGVPLDGLLHVAVGLRLVRVVLPSGSWTRASIVMDSCVMSSVRSSVTMFWLASEETTAAFAVAKKVRKAKAAEREVNLFMTGGV